MLPSPLDPTSPQRKKEELCGSGKTVMIQSLLTARMKPALKRRLEWCVLIYYENNEGDALYIEKIVSFQTV